MQEIYRPQAEKRKIHSKNEFELCYIRHQYFRRVKYNPTEAEMTPYKSIIGYLSRRTYYTYSKLFHIVGMTYDDVQAIGNIHLVNFIGLFEIGPTKNVEKYEDFIVARHKKYSEEITDKELLSKNKANFTLFMKQRMEDLVRICKQKAKNIRGCRVDEYIAFYGSQPPPGDIYKLLENCKAHGYKRIDNVTFKACRKRSKSKRDVAFQWAGYWYVTVPISQQPLTYTDLEGAGFDQRENEHNLNPEQILLQKHEEIRIDKKIKVFKNSTKESKVRTIMEFVEKNGDDPLYRDEIFTAKKMLKTLGHKGVG